MAGHRVSLLRSSLRRRSDPAQSRDPRVREIVAQLAELELTSDPDPQFRSELREQLVAIAPRIVAEGEVASSAAAAATETEGSKAPRAAGTRRAKHAAPRGRIAAIARPVRIVTAALAVVALLLGGAFWMSRDTLPGDNLYGLKRAGESIELSLAGSDRDRAADRLDFARTRVGEVKALWTNATSSAMSRGAMADAGVSDATADLITDALASADSDVTAAASLLNNDAVRTRSASPLTQLRTWASGQLSRLRFIENAMPASHLRDHVIDSSRLVDRAMQRSAALSAGLDCSCSKDARTDKLGPVPCSTCTTTPSAPPSNPAGTAASSGTSGPSGGGSSGNTEQRNRSESSTGSGSRPKSAAHTTSPSDEPARSGGPKSTSRPSASLPTTPAAPKVDIKVCITVPAGPIGVSVGACPTS